MIGVGDLVVCVRREPWHQINVIIPPLKIPSYGEVFRVTRSETYYDRPFLYLRECGGSNAFDAKYFVPLNDEPENTAIIRKIKQCKPRRVSA